MSATKNETVLIEWNDTLFSENLYAFFEYGMIPVLSDKIEDVLLPEDYTFNKLEGGAYEIFEYNKDCDDYLYVGRLFTPKDKPLEE